jgi:hypothetical protein
MMTPTLTSRAPAALLALCFLVLGPAAPTAAQSVQGDPEDLQFEIVNATTGQPGTIERLEIHYSTQRLNPVLDVEPEGSAFTVPQVPIKDIGRYVITAWKHGVPYFWSIRGRQILDGPIKLHVFDTSADMTGVTLTGLNLLLRKGESLMDVEYLLKVDNPARPQVTILASPTLELAVPPGAAGFKAHYTRGPEPIDINVQPLAGDRIGLDAPLTTGQNQIRLTFTVEWREGIEIPVGANVPVQAWSLLATPENLDVRGREMEPDHSQDIPGYLRFRGPALEADRNLPIALRGSIPAGEAEEVFTAEAEGQEGGATGYDSEKNEGSSFPWPVPIAILVVIIALIARRRRSG